MTYDDVVNELRRFERELEHLKNQFKDKNKVTFPDKEHLKEGGFNSEVHNSTCIEKEISCL